MPSPPRRTSEPLRAFRLVVGGLVLVGASGCDLLSGVPAGTIVGEIRYDGRPAAGLTVRLQKYGNDGFSDVTSGSDVVKATTDSAGQYRFQKVAAGSYRVRFERIPLLVGGIPVGPSQVGTWNSPLVTSGSRAPTFDVAFNGLIYPESGKASAYSAAAGIPFHWSTHREGVSYRVRLYDITGGGQRDVWKDSPWGPAPYVVFKVALPKGNYRWEVMIDGGGTGTGTSEQRNVDLDYQEPAAAEE